MNEVIYCVQHSATGMAYVGQTTIGCAKRWSQHIINARRSGKKPYFYRALAKHGPDAFEVTVLAEAKGKAERDLLERLWILTLRTFDPKCGYNGTFGGDGVVATEAVRRALSKPKPPRSEEHCRRLSIAKKGKPSPRKGVKFTEEQRVRHGQVRKGMIAWNKGLKGQVPWNKGLQTPPEVREKQRVSALNRKGRI